MENMDDQNSTRGTGPAASGAISSATVSEQRPPEPHHEEPLFEHPDASGFDGYVATLKAVMLNPSSTFARLSTRRQLGRAVFFVMITSFISTIGTSAAMFITETGPALLHGGNAPEAIANIIGIAIAPICMLVIAPVFLLIQSAIYHLLFLLFRFGEKPFETTVKLFSYSTAPQVLFIIPIAGTLAGTLWSIIVTVIAIRETQGVSTFMAALVFFLPLLLCCGIFLGLFTLGGVLAALGLGAMEMSSHNFGNF